MSRKILTSSQVQHFSLAVMPVSRQYSSSGGSRRITSNLDFSSLISKASKSACRYLFKQSYHSGLKTTPHSTSVQPVTRRVSCVAHIAPMHKIQIRCIMHSQLTQTGCCCIKICFLKLSFNKQFLGFYCGKLETTTESPSFLYRTTHQHLRSKHLLTG